MTLSNIYRNFNGFSNVAGVAAIIRSYSNIIDKTHFDGFRCSDY
jgi:hypothetical protein